ncbi:hypothetical protein GE09DRAFT_714206 [Coniochaeta sp. 2T2.1]|nr:hypothetical protein GE09DRAFT_714206 [Coniochaeta sp. 2T2.1]
MSDFLRLVIAKLSSKRRPRLVPMSTSCRSRSAVSSRAGGSRDSRSWTTRSLSSLFASVLSVLSTRSLALVLSSSSWSSDLVGLAGSVAWEGPAPHAVSSPEVLLREDEAFPLDVGLLSGIRLFSPPTFGSECIQINLLWITATYPYPRTWSTRRSGAHERMRRSIRAWPPPMH